MPLSNLLKGNVLDSLSREMLLFLLRSVIETLMRAIGPSSASLQGDSLSSCQTPLFVASLANPNNAGCPILSST
jgi:hypothetical protein